MANSVKLIINEIEADFSKDSDLAPRIYKQSFDIRSLIDKKGDFTLNLKLPKTDKNKKIFSFIGDPQQDKNFFNLQPYNASIITDDAEVIRGILTIDRVTPDALECTILGTNISFAEILDNQILRDIKSLPVIRYTGLTNSVFPSWDEQEPNSVGLTQIWGSSESPFFNYNVQFPLLSYGNFASDPNDSTVNSLSSLGTQIRNSAGELLGSNIYRPQTYPFNQFEFKPAGYIKSIINAIFKDLGYRCQGTFISDVNTDNLLLPFVDSAGAEPKWNWGLLGKAKATTVQNMYGSTRHYGLGDNLYITNPDYPKWSLFTQDYSSNVGLGDIVNGSLETGFTIGNIIFNERKYDYSSSFEPTYSQYIAPVTGYYVFNLAMGLQFNVRWSAVTLSPPQKLAVTPANYLDVNDNKLVIFGVKNTYNGTSLNVSSIPASDLNSIRNGINPDPNKYLMTDNLFGEHVTEFQSNGQYQNINYTTTSFYYNASAGSITFNKMLLNEGECMTFCVLTDRAKSPLPDMIGVVDYLIDDIVYIIDPVLIVTPLTDESEVVFDYDLSVAKVLPDIKTKDFLKSIFNLYNLKIIVDDSSKLININYAKDYFLPQSTGFDWSSKVDIEQATIEPVNAYKEFKFLFTHEDGETLLDPNNYDYTYTNTSNYYTLKDQLEVIFAAITDREYTFQAQSNLKLRIPTMSNKAELAKTLGKLGSGDEKINYKYVPRIVKWDGLTQPDPTLFDGFWIGEIQNPNPNPSATYYRYRYTDDFGFGGGVFSYPKASVITNTDYALNWNTLVPKYYLLTLTSLEKSIIVTVPVYLTAADVAQLDVRRPIIINGQTYIINLINGFNPVDDGTTEVEFFKK